MPIARTEHEIKIKADARAVKSAGDEIRKAFSPKSTQSIKFAVRDLDQQIKALTSQQKRLNQELDHINRGTDNYKRLKNELKGVQEQAKQVQSTLEQITRANAKAAQTQAAQRGSFVAGLGQGLGITQYIPTGPGMMARMGGAMVGRGIRRGAGAATAPFLMPGIGGLSQALQAIPGFGTAASGALQMASGFFQQAVGFQRAQQANLFLGAGGFRQQAANIRNIPGGIGVSGATQKALQLAEVNEKRATAQLNEANSAENWEKAYNQANRFVRNKMMEQAKAQERVGVRVEGGRRVTGAEAAIAARRNAAIIQKMSIAGAPGALIGEAVRAITETKERPYGIAAPNVQEIQQRLIDKQKLQAKLDIEKSRRDISDLKERANLEGRKARWDAYQKAVGNISQLGAGFGTEFGFMPTQVQGMLGQFGRTRGGLLTQRMRGEFREALAAQVVAGTSMQQAGGFYRMFRPGGGGGEYRSLSETLAAAFVQKLEGGEIGEYLDSLVQLGRQAEQQGVKIDPREFQRGTGLLGALGMKGLQAQRAVTGISSAAMQLSQTGVRGPQDMLLLRAAGYDPAKGPLSYVRAINKLEGGISGEGGTQILTNLLSMMVKGVSGTGVFQEPEMQAFYLRRVLNPLTKIGAGTATSIIKGYDQKTGQLDPKVVAQVQSMNRKTESAGASRDIITVGAGRARVGAGLAVTAAGLATKQIGLGAGMGDLMVKLQESSTLTVKTLNNFSNGLITAVNKVNDFIKAIEIFTRGNIVDDFLSRIGRNNISGNGGIKGGGGGK